MKSGLRRSKCLWPLAFPKEFFSTDMYRLPQPITHGTFDFTSASVQASIVLGMLGCSVRQHYEVTRCFLTFQSHSPRTRLG